MNTVYVICEPVDLGYHMVAGFASHDRAKAELDRMVQQARKEKIIGLIKGCNYTQQKAEQYVQHTTFYELEMLEIEE